MAGEAESKNLGEKLMDAFFEGKTVRQALAGLLYSMHVVANHPETTESVKEEILKFQPLAESSYVEAVKAHPREASESPTAQAFEEWGEAISSLGAGSNEESEGVAASAAFKEDGEIFAVE